MEFNKSKPQANDTVLKPSLNYSEFGKFMIQTIFLDKDILLIKYKKSYAPIPSIRRTKISSTMASIIQDLLTDKPEINYKLLNELEDIEQDLFIKLITKAGLTQTLNFKKNLIELNGKKLVDKYNILKGQIIAGNNNTEIMDDIEKLIPKLIKVGKLTEEKGNEILELVKDL